MMQILFYGPFPRIVGQTVHHYRKIYKYWWFWFTTYWWCEFIMIFLFDGFVRCNVLLSLFSLFSRTFSLDDTKKSPPTNQSIKITRKKLNYIIYQYVWILYQKKVLIMQWKITMTIWANWKEKSTKLWMPRYNNR